MPSPFDDPNAPVQQEKINPADTFVKMAEQIQHNAGAPFGGAFVIHPPSGEEPLTALILTSDPAQFWMMVSAKIQIRLREIELKEQNASAFGRR